MGAITAIIPFRDGAATIGRLLDSLPNDMPVIVVDDLSKAPYQSNRKNVTVIRLAQRGYFTGAVNVGMSACNTDVLILNQDSWFEDVKVKWLDLLHSNSTRYAMIGERIKGTHPAWVNGYIHGTFLFARRDVIDRVGLMNASDYPLWGSTCEYQLRFARAGYEILPLPFVPGFRHERKPGERFGSAIVRALKDEPAKQSLFIRTPPEISVIVPCYNYGRFLPDLVNSLIGGDTVLGRMNGQTFQSFEIMIVDDASTDDTPDIIAGLVDPWKGIHSIRLPKNVGTAAANNAGIKACHGRYIAVMGADDMMEEWRLRELYDLQIKNPHSIIYDNVMPFMDGRRKTDMRIGVSAYDFERLLTKNHIHAGILMPKTAWAEIGGYPESFNDGREDWAINVGLGIAGYCGVFLDKKGYLYRRALHNRTNTNTTPGHRQKFFYKLVRTYPNIYAGERPIMCCGNGSGVAKTVSSISKIGGSIMKLSDIPGLKGDGNGVLIMYKGRNVGTETTYGPATGKKYRYGGNSPFVYVDERDLHTGSSRKPGLLDINEHGKPVFVLYVPPKKVEVVPIVVAEPVDTETADVIDTALADAEPVENNPSIVQSELPAIDKPVLVEAETVKAAPAKPKRAPRKKAKAPKFAP